MQQKAKLLLPLLVVALGAGLAIVIVRARPTIERQSAAVPPPLVRVVEVDRRDVPLTVASHGTVTPRTESTLVAEVAGRLEWVSPAFAEGGFFGRGEVLARIEDADYRLAVAQAEAQMAQAKVRLERESAEAEVARREWEELGGGEAPPLTRREPQLAEARAAVGAAEAALEQARLNLERTRIGAPFDGRVRTKQADLGQFVARGTPLGVVYSTDAAELRLPVPQQELAYLEIELGTAAGNPGPGSHGPEVVLTGRLGETAHRWRGQVVRTGGGFDPRTRMLPLIAEVEDPLRRRAGAGGQPLPMGLFVEAEIAGRTARDVAVLPREALRPGDQVLVVDGEGRLRFRTVEVYRRQRDEVLVAAGLEAGELVCVSPLETAVDGMRVRTLPDGTGVTTDAGREEEL